MPLNSLVCPQCSAHINYAVDIEHEVQTVVCRRCKAPVQVAVRDLDPVIRETVEQLIAQRRSEQAEQEEYAAVLSREEDSVDVAIDRAQSAFTEARDRLFGLAEGMQDLTDTMGIVDQFVVGEGLDDLSAVAGAEFDAAARTAAAAASAVAGAVASRSGKNSPLESSKRGGTSTSSRIAEKLSGLDEDKVLLMYGKELYTYCKTRNIKLIDAVSDTEWQKWFISTLKVADDAKSLLNRLVESEQVKNKVSAIVRRLAN
ncbi:MAG: hypothetical protein IKD70_06750 [Eggerthellaceae bacterium]|nr:hypothetical protein [Eggerthellaceae bacterium]